MKTMRWLIISGLLSAVCWGPIGENTASAQNTAEIPQIASDWWPVATVDDLGALQIPQTRLAGHGFFQTSDGAWQLVASVQRTHEGLLLYAWEGASLDRVLWKPRNVLMRGGQIFNAKMDRVEKEELLSPSGARNGETWYCFFAGQGALGQQHEAQVSTSDICYATSSDGRQFNRPAHDNYKSCLFTGPGMNRDPMILKIHDTFHCYYYSCIEQGKNGIIALRTSRDLKNWSEYKPVKQVPSPVSWYSMSPFVVQRGDQFYLFLTHRSQDSAHHNIYKTDVYGSMDPADFGKDSKANYLTTLECSASEILNVGNDWYISTVGDGRSIKLAKLKWVAGAAQ